VIVPPLPAQAAGIVFEGTAFEDAVLVGTQAAIRRAKRRRGVCCRTPSANRLPRSPDLSEQQIFIALVGRRTDWHLLLVAVFQSPRDRLAGSDYRRAITSSLAPALQRRTLRSKAEGICATCCCHHWPTRGIARHFLRARPNER
jgi:hypothetical protein